MSAIRGKVKSTTIGRYITAIKATPRGVFNFQLFLVVLTYALGGCPKGWDEGSAASITQLKSFARAFGLSSGNAIDNQKTISNLVSFVNLGAGIGPLMTIPISDAIGRRWSYRLWQLVYAIGIIVQVATGGNIGALYAGRIISGLGIGALTVIGPAAIAESAPRTVRGLLGFTFNIAMVFAQVIGVFSVYGVQQTISSALHIQWQTPIIVQLLVPVFGIALSFCIPESPRFLLAKGDEAGALRSLLRTRCLPEEHPYVAEEFSDMLAAHTEEKLARGGAGWLVLLKECFTVPNYFRRTRTVIIAYILAQFSGANSITNYLPTILGLVGIKSSQDKILFTGGYSVAKLVCLIIASLLLVDIVGRRKSLLIGVTVQGLCHIYMAVYLKYQLSGAKVGRAASDMAIAAIYIHALGWGCGLLPLPYLFGAELFPTRVRSVGGALGQSFHWLFYFGITKATPSLLAAMHGWGAFVFFATWCAIAWGYGYIMVPETAGRSLEGINRLFDLKWYEIRKNAYPTEEELLGRVEAQVVDVPDEGAEDHKDQVLHVERV